MNSYCDTTAAGVAVVARECSLASLIELEIFRQGQGVRGYDKTLLQKCAKLFGAIRHQNFPSVT